MSTNGARAAIYLRVSRDDQTTENQRLVLEKVAEHRGWLIVQTYEDQGISGAKEYGVAQFAASRSAGIRRFQRDAVRDPDPDNPESRLG
jgi:DNA invertase Pin-like site-specific DNA recombinase